MASRRRRRTRRIHHTRRARRRHGGRVVKAKLRLRKRHAGAKYVCIHPKSGRKTYHRKKSAANRACGK